MKPLLFAMFFVFVPVYAESDMVLWVPEDMIAGEQYEGVVITPKPVREGLLVLLSASDGVEIPESVFIRPYQNHGIFRIIPVLEGDAEILAASEGDLYSAFTRIYSQTSRPESLQIILPAQNTKTDSMSAFVMLVDHNGSPASFNADTDVSISTSESIRAPHDVTIRANTTQARFEMSTDGSGHIIASSGSLSPGRADIEKIQDKYTVRIAIAPDIAMNDSHAFFYVWLEKDGRPYHPPRAVDAFIHSGNDDIVRLHPNPYSEGEGFLVHLIDGVAKGVLYTGDSGHATVTASVKEFGTAQDTIFVGEAEFAGIDDSFDVVISEQDPTRKGDTKYSPNILRVWAYPDVTDGSAWLVAAAYHVNRTQSVELLINHSGLMDGLITDDAVVIPAEYDGSIFVSSNGLEHEGIYRMEQSITKTNAFEFSIAGGYGSYDVTVSGQGLEPGSTVLNVVAPYFEGYDIGIVPIPGHADTERDIAMVSVMDMDGSMIDGTDVFGRDVSFRISADSAALHSGMIRPDRSGTAIVSGILSGTGNVTAIMDGVGSQSVTILPVGVSTSVELLAPQLVHIDEPFPFAVHETDPLGIPVRKATDWKISSPLGITTSDNRMTLSRPGDAGATIISHIGASEYEMSGFENVMNVDVDIPKDRFRLGEEIVLDIVNSIDAYYTLITDYPFKQVSDDRFVITPDVRDDSATFSVLASRDGYETVTVSETVRVEEVYLLEVITSDMDGNGISVPFEIVMDGRQLDARSPYHAELEPGILDVVFSEKIADSSGYVLDDISMDGRMINSNSIRTTLAGDVTITATYGQEVLVEVIDGQGSGVYRRGDAVDISAPDRDVVWFLVRDTFDGWDGFDADSSRTSFVADRDVRITAIYREDYTYLMVLVITPLILASSLVMYRGAAGTRWRLQNLLEGLVGRKIGDQNRSAPKSGTDSTV